MSEISCTRSRAQTVKHNTLLRSMADKATMVLMAGIPAYALINAVYHQSLTYLSYFLWLAVAAILFWIIARFSLNPGYRLLILCAIWMSIAGRIYFYENVSFFDKILHVLTPFLVTCITYDFIASKQHKNSAAAVFLTASALLCLFEIFEYLLDYYSFFQFNTRGVYDQNQGQVMSPAMDTFYDLTLGMTSALLAVLMRKKQGQNGI